MQQVAQVASGYVYYVSLKGVTGAGTLDTGRWRPCCRASASMCRSAGGRRFWHPRRAVGLRRGPCADAVVIGSRIIQLIEDQPRDQVVAVALLFLRGIRERWTHNPLPTPTLPLIPE
jgi:tryptophan synthase alpha chain